MEHFSEWLMWEDPDPALYGLGHSWTGGPGLYKKAELTPKVLSEIQVQETFRTSNTHDHRRVLPDILCWGSYAMQEGNIKWY